jgi:hypothetical protein
MRAVVFALIAGSLPIGAYATNSFNGSGSAPMTRFTAPIEAATFDGTIWVTNEGKRIQVEIGTPSMMMKHGLRLSALEVGKTVTVDAFSSSSDDPTRLYARRIVIDGRIVDLR